MKILVIFTGGTIGSALNDGWISPDGQTKKQLISHYEKAYGNDICFATKEPYSILSENLCADNINQLVSVVKDEIDADFDGIIVTHGTDTLQYSAAALSFALGSCHIPVLMVSSNYPLDDDRTNGHVNFAAAVEFIKAKAGKGVFAVYRNDNHSVYFHKALSLLTHREGNDSLHSFGSKYFAKLTDEGFVVSDKLSQVNETLDFTLCKYPQILVVNAYPGESYDYNLENYKAVILRPYHSGTLDTANEKFEQFCVSAAKKGIPVFVVNVKEGTTYESSKEFDNYKIIPLYSYSFVSAYMRLWIGISRNDDLNKIF